MSFPNNPTAGKGAFTRPLESITNAYWQPEAIYKPQKTLQSYDHHLGFSIDKPRPLPSLTTVYNGGGGEVIGARQLVFTQFAEGVAPGGKLPYSGGRPLVSPQDLDFRREKFIRKV